jgi:DNA-binding MarR family transcriptional regulator
MERALSSPSPERLRAWRLYFESALALTDVLGAELEHDAGISLRWYDVLVQLEDSPEGIPMNQLAERILHSKSGFTRVVDRMEEEGLVRRVRPEHDRRTILVVLTDTGNKTKERARLYHRDGIERHFAQHLTDADVKALTRALEKVSTHARPLRPGRIRS